MSPKVDRRQFIRGSASVATLAHRSTSYFPFLARDLPNLLLGTTPGSWGIWFPHDAVQLPWRRFLDEVREAGYRFTELGPFGYLPIHTSELRRELNERSLGISAGHVRAHLESSSQWPQLEKKVLATGELLAAVEAKHLILIDDTNTGYFTGPPLTPERLDSSAWKVLVDNVQRVARLAFTKFGLRLAFHPHAYSHVQYTDQIEALMDQTDTSLVSLCLDTGHCAFRQIDPVEFMRKHHQRVSYLHLQNVDGKIRREVLALGKNRYENVVGRGVFCDPEDGIVDFSKLHDVLRQIDFRGWAIVEREIYPAAWNEPLGIATKSLAYYRGKNFA